MKHLTILVPEVRNNIIGIATIYEIFKCANAYWSQTGGGNYLDFSPVTIPGRQQ